MTQRLALFGVTAAAVLGVSVGLLTLMIWFVPWGAQSIVGPAALCVSCLAATAVVWLGSRQADRWRTGVAFGLVAAPIAAMATPAVALAAGLYLFPFYVVIRALAVASLGLGVLSAAALTFGHRIGRGRVLAAAGLSALGMVWFIYVSLPSPPTSFDPLNSFGFRFNLAMCFALALVAAGVVGAWAAWAYRPVASEPTPSTPGVD